MKEHQQEVKILNRLFTSVFFSILFVLLAGCNSTEKTQAVIQGITDDNLVSMVTATQPMIVIETTPAPETPIGDEGAGEEEPQVSATATPDLRLDPVDWMNWPIVPTLSGQAKNIYLSGSKMGRNPQAFSKVGDCQSIREVLLGIYDLPGRYILPNDDGYLQETIDYFAGSFNRDGYAVKGGFNAATVLSPIWADPEVCLAGETPLACEFRIQNPSMVIISLEVWWDGRTPDRYEQYMRKIIEYSISQGVLPILSTKADNVEGDHSINAVTARLAYEYDIPLWNFWLAAQALPDHGIDPDRDGFHITVAAWNERSYTALKTIDQLWRSAFEDSSITTQETPSVTPTKSQITINAQNFSQELDLPLDLPGQLVFELSQNDSDGILQTAGVYRLSFDENELVRIAPQGNSLLDVGYGFMLIHDVNTGQLKLLEYSGKEVAVEGLSQFTYTTGGGLFVDANRFLVVGAYDEKNGIWLLDRQEGTYSLLVSVDINRSELQSANDSALFWLERDQCNNSLCNEMTLHKTGLETLNTSDIIHGGDPKIDTMGQDYVYYLTQDNVESVYLSSVTNSSSQYIGLYGNVLLDYEWSPGGNDLVVLKMLRSDYFGKATDILHYAVNKQSLIVREFPSVLYLNPDVEWSPDGGKIITSGTVFTVEGGYDIGLRLLQVDTGGVFDLGSDLLITSSDYITITHLQWVE